MKSPPDLIRRTAKLFREQGIVADGDRVLVGCSGGIDSATLLYVLNEVRKEIPFDLGVAHINHLLRNLESERDENFVRHIALKYGLPFYRERADVKGYAAARGLSLQHAGRDIRYRFLNETADGEGYTRIATAHNLDDQIETFILRLIKGSGIRGLSSIPPTRDRIIRPFLNVYRSEIASFAESCSIAFVEDSSNEKTIYERNYIRHRIMPLFEEINGAFREKIASLLGDINRVNSIFDQEKESFMRHVQHKGKDIAVPLKRFSRLDEEVRYRVMADIFAHFAPSFVPLREHIRLVENILSSEKPNLRVDLPSGLKAKRVYENLIFTTRPAREASREITEVRDGASRISRLDIDIHVKTLKKPPASFPKNPYTAFFDADRCDRLTVRTFRPGDRFCPLGMAQSVKLKDFFISRKIPLEARKNIPLLLSGDDIIWVVGYRIDERYKVTPDSVNVVKVTVKKTCQPS